MNRRDFLRKISYGLGRVGIAFCDSLSILFPVSIMYAVARGVSRVGFALARRHRRIAMESLSKAFGKEKSPQEIERIARDCYYSMAATAVEFFMFMRHHERIKQYVEIQGLEHLKAALSKGKGVVAISAHFGSFPLLLSRLALEGIKIHTVLRHMRDPGLDKVLEAKRDRLGVGSIYTQPRTECVNQCLKALRQNEVVFVQLDQNFGTAGVFVDFFGVKAATATGPVIFSLRTGAPIVPMFIYRLEGPRHKIEILPMMELEAEGDREAVVFSMVERLTKLIEGYIRRAPHEWGWIHKRWKARPKGETS
jgi:KDO2-lipid IV(A) lauroyltransferase